MSDLDLDELVRRLRAGEDPAEVQRSLVNPDRQEILRRCAVPRTFDRTVFDSLLQTPTGLSFDQLVSDGYAERVPGPEPLLRLRGETRAEWLGQWPTGPEDRVPPGVARLSGGLAEAYAARGDELEELYHRAVADPVGAAPRVAQLFDAADRQFDLAACQDVLDILSEPSRLQWLGPELAELRADRHAYLRARSYWSTEWLQSARYLNRPSLDGKLKALLDSRSSRAMQVYAPGGSGKTIQLRWFIARWCVPKPRRIPCARIDFDLVSAPAVGARPWLLLLELADQLNRQLAGAPFQELLNDRGVLRALLDPRPSRAVLSAISQLGTEPRQVADEVTDRFVRTLVDTTGDRPVLLVFDTFEEVLLSPDGDPDAILRLLDELRRRCGSVRLLVAGRYDLRRRVRNLNRILPGLVSTEVRPFSERECQSYLRRMRGLRDTDLTEAMIAKCHGDPFVLALLADLARDKEGLTADEVLAYEDPQTLKLVERIIARVDDPAVRWLLRYGVVPRRLSRDFAAQVIYAYLREGMSGTSKVDTPQTDDLPGAGAASLFPTDVLSSAEAPLDLDAVWQRLLQYAADSSWVSLRAEHPDSVLFHPDLVTPMRRVLRGQAVFRELHRVAAAYCARKADQEPRGWLQWTREAIYHRFQAGAADTGAAWLTALDVAEERDGSGHRLEIANEILGRDYVDENGTPLPFDDQTPIVGWNLLARAHLERARAFLLRAERASTGAARELVEPISRELRQVNRIRADHGVDDPPETELVLLNARVERLRGSSSSAHLQVIQKTLLAVQDTADRIALTEVLADGLRDSDPDRAVDYYTKMLAMVANDAATRIGRKLSALLADRDRVEAALRVINTLPAARNHTEADGLTLIEDARVWLQAGRVAELRRRIDETEAAFPAITAAKEWCRAAAHLAMGEPFAALSRCEKAMRRPGRPLTGPQLRVNLELAELHAVVNATLLKLDDAYAELEYVTSGWRELGDVDRSWGAAGAPADFDLRGGATLRAHAQYLLFSSRDAQEQRAGEGWFRRQLNVLRVAIEQDNPDRDRLLRQTMDALGRDMAPRRAVRLAIVTMGLDPVDAVRLLLDGLRRMDSRPARLALLTPLRRCAPVPVTETQRAELADLLGHAPPVQDVLQLTWAEYQRVFGDRQAAAEAIRDIAGRWADTRPTRERDYRRWLVLDAAERLGADTVIGAPDVTENDRGPVAEPTPVLDAATLVLTALRSLADPRVEAWLDQAERSLSKGGGSGSEWEVYLHIARALSAVAAPERGHPWQEYRDQAERTWTRIWPNRPMPYAERFAALLGRGSDAPAPPVGPSAEESPTPIVYQLVWDDRALVVRTPGSGPRADRTLQELSRTLDHALSSELDILVDELQNDEDRLVHRLGDLMADLPEASDDLLPVNVVLQTDSTLIGAMPWELALLTANGRHRSDVGGFRRNLSDSLTVTHMIAALQRGLRTALRTELGVDGLYGPETKAAAQKFQRDGNLFSFDASAWLALYRAVSISGKGRPEVVVVRPSTRQELSHGRGGLSEGVDIAQLYQRHGFNVHTVADASPPMLVDIIRSTTMRGRFAVLHVAGGFGGAHNDVYVEFASEREVTNLEKWVGEGSSSAFFGTTFDRAFAALPPELTRPLVILDPGRPKGYSEAARQLLLRNSFAHHLLELGNIPTVLAMGLDRGDQYRRRNDVVRRLAEGSTADEVARDLRRTIGGEGRLAAGVVLSTHLPPDAMPRWWTTS